MITIYKITSPSESVYIGKTKNLYRRLNSYRSNHCERQTLLYNSFIEFGFFNHKVEICTTLPDDINPRIADDYEILYIDLYRNCGLSMLNISNGGSMAGKHAQSTRSKISEKLKGRTSTFFGKNHTEETRAKMRVSQKGHTNSKRGDASTSSKLTNADVLDIRNSTESSRKLGVKYGVNKCTILRIKNLTHRKYG